MSPLSAHAGGAEERRLASLRRLDVLDTPADPEIRDIIDLVARLLTAPYAALTYVDGERVWSPAVAGSDEPLEVPRVCSPAARAVESGQTVLDLGDEAGQAEGLDGHPVLGGDPRLPRVVVATVHAPDGEPVGALEAAWEEGRDLDERDLRVLTRAVRHVARLLELRSEVDEYRRFIELSPEAVAVLDLEGCIELANPAFSELLGCEGSADISGRPFIDLVVPADRERVAAELARVLFARRATASLDLGLLRADGTTVHGAVTAGHLQGSRRSLQLSIHDLEGRIRAEEERARLSEQLAQAQRLDLAGQLASGLAHDLNNLLLVMNGNLDMAAESLRRLEVDDAAREPLREDLDQVRTAVDRAGQLTEKLMQFARRESEAVTEVSVADALTAVERLIGSSLPAEVGLCFEVEEDLPSIAVDPVQFEQVLVNLVMNARDALPEGGTITVRAARVSGSEPDPRGARGRVERTGSDVHIEVLDDGVGMSDETLTRAFEPLYTTKGAVRGSGLGLPTVLAFAEAVGGTVDLSSREGEGTTVTLLLPAAVAEAGPAAETAEGAPGTAGARVLLVDPGEQARRIVTRMLEGAGYAVHPVASPEEAVEALDEHGTDVLVTELALPRGSGWRLVEQLRGRAPDLPALVFSPAEAGLDAEGVRTLVKPFSHDRLLRALEELLDAGA